MGMVQSTFIACVCGWGDGGGVGGDGGWGGVWVGGCVGVIAFPMDNTPQ